LTTSGEPFAAWYNCARARYRAGPAFEKHWYSPVFSLIFVVLLCVFRMLLSVLNGAFF